MKIGILTYHFANNYGAVLQAYALQRKLECMGHTVEFIDYRSPMQKSNNALIMDKNSAHHHIKNFIRMPHYFSRKKRIFKFEMFRKENLKISENSFSRIEQVVEYAEKNFDLIIVGSDQVWNPYAPDFEEIYFKISQCKVPVVTYAVSFGVSKEKELKKYEMDILKFKKVSVREEKSIDILKNVNSEIETIGVLDPTLLLEECEYDRIAASCGKVKDGYIACYYLGRKNAMRFKKAVYELARRFNLKVYFINANYGLNSYGRGVLNDCGPTEFLGIIKNATLVCTNSFHAVAFSIILKTPFYTFENTSLNDTRKTDLLRRLAIKDRVINDFNVSEVRDYKMQDLDIKHALTKYRESSNVYIKQVTN